MDNLIADLCDILEVEDLPLDISLAELPEWDSLNALSIIALLDSKYNIHIDSQGLMKFATINEFLGYIAKSKN